jgi:hypothetical protein
MVDFGQESDLRWGHWVIVWKEELELEDTAYQNMSGTEICIWLEVNPDLHMETGWGRESRRQNILDYPREAQR